MNSSKVKPAMTPYQQVLQQAKDVYHSLEHLEDNLTRAAVWTVESLSQGGKLLICGNGGSACEAQHLAGELVGRYKGNRRALPAIALNADGATMSCIGNDYRFEDVFSRQIEALGRPGDLLIVFTSSGRSHNICEALRAARQAGMRSIAFLGRGGGPALELADLVLLVASVSTARVQEAHQFLLHSLMDQIESRMGLSEGSSIS